ncbi:hypothetical protein XENOCAPTIV_004229 [Xenoophorus captivus]|uniref:Uncharacterized protein n=1 Tax=Xenoophorus captivus TaxID=1517983 RepID=A0ABV0QL66_9TELE
MLSRLRWCLQPRLRFLGSRPARLATSSGRQRREVSSALQLSAAEPAPCVQSSAEPAPLLQSAAEQAPSLNLLLPNCQQRAAAATPVDPSYLLSAVAAVSMSTETAALTAVTVAAAAALWSAVSAAETPLTPSLPSASPAPSSSSALPFASPAVIFNIVALSCSVI